jgi:glutathione S-transferase
MKLHFHPYTASSRRVLLFLGEKGLELPRVFVDVKGSEHFTDAYRRKNPAGTVPLLELDDGTFLSESVAICRYLELLHPDPPLFGVTPKEQAVVEMWQRRVELEGLLPCFDTFRNRDPVFDGRARAGWAAGLPRIPELVQRTPILLGRLLGWIDDELAEHPWVAGERFSIPDITLWVALDVALRLSVVAARTLPSHVADWKARVAQRPAFAG